jgi:asparagine synthase (glutamine-hydrolysing)
MCGIAGLLHLNGDLVSSASLRRMTDAISHRGPDGEGYWFERNIGFGHRRLAIIDPSVAGHQPMVSSDHRYVLTYNGEVYNYRDIKKRLEAEGIWFRSNTDTEVVLYALAIWGTNAFLLFNGMFALAFWDRKEQSLILARDRYGIKPLYYSSQGSNFSFASEQKSIIADPSFDRRLNQHALREYFTFQNIFTDQTLLEDISMLPAGSFLTLKPRSASKNIRLCRYWDYQFSDSGFSKTKTEYVEELDHLFRQAVHRQLASDVEIGTYLSGGIDSGSVTALATQQVPNLKSFTIGFDLSSASGLELAFDERARAEAMSAAFKTEHYEMVLKAGDMERILSKLSWHLEEPRVGQSYPNYYAAQLASKFVKVVLGGTGGDELFGGYPWRYYRAVSAKNFDNYIDDYYSVWQRLLSCTELSALLSPIWSNIKDVSTKDIFRGVFLTHDNELKRPEDYINHSLYFEAKTFLHGLFLVEDKLSMAHGLENRVPFMDNDLVDFAMKCPVNLKLANLRQAVRINENDAVAKKKQLFQKSSDGKQLLRAAMSNYIPLEIIQGNKQGFSSPDASWFKGESIDFVRRRLLGNESCITSVIDPVVMNTLLQQHLDGSQNRRLLIWSLLTVDAWMSEFL